MRMRSKTVKESTSSRTHFNLLSLFRRHATASKLVHMVEAVLPQEIHKCILLELETLHRSPVAPTCSTCLLRDFSSYSKVCREWHSAAVPRLYARIWITGAESSELKKHMRIKHGCRALLLRRTLLCRPDYAAHVKELKLPEYNLDMVTTRKLKEIRAITSSVVRCCTNLEKLIGCYQYYKVEDEDDMQSALMSRRSLKEHIWVMASNGQLQTGQSEAFINSHSKWSKLETLVLQGGAGTGTGSLNSLTFSGVFQELPMLKKLFVSRFHNYEFHNNTLLWVPVQIECLRLEDLPGVTDAGISALVDKLSHHGQLRSLALIELELLSLAVISKLLSGLNSLEKFTLLQTSSPQPPLADRNRRTKKLISSKSLKFLHWDLLIPGSANTILARSIHNDQFPSLHTLRAPSDHHGILQAVCMPLEKILLPFDPIEARLIIVKQKKQDEYYYSEDRYNRTLPKARINAQERIDEVQKAQSMKAVVTEAGIENKLLEIELKAFMGDVKSKVAYSLLPDLEGAEEAVVGVPEYVESRIKAEWKWAAGCTGKWNKVSRCRSYTHTERVRGFESSDLALDLLF